MEDTPDSRISPGFKIEDDLRITDGSLCIEWTIKNYKSLMQKEPLQFIKSPSFRMRDATWGLALMNTGLDVLPHLHLRKCESETRHSITFQMMLHINKEEIFATSPKTVLFEEENPVDTDGDCSVNSKYLSECMTRDNLTLFCFVYPEVQEEVSVATSTNVAKEFETYSNTSHGGIRETAENGAGTFSPLFEVESAQDSFRITEGLLCISWKIENYKSLKITKPAFMRSRTFIMRDARWYLSLHHTAEVEEVLGYLNRPKCKSESKRHSITYVMMMVHGYEGEEIEGFLKFVLFDERNSLVSGGSVSLNSLYSTSLTVNCIVFPELQEPASEAVSKSVFRGVEEYWNRSHEGIDILVSNMKDLFLNEENCDLVIKVKGRDFHVHRAIVAVRSPVLSAMLQHDMAEKNSGSIDIVDCEPDVFEYFLRYLYTGCVEEISWSYVINLYTLADKYDLPHLRKECLQFMEGNLYIEAFCDAITLAVKHNELTLVKCAENFFLKNVKSILVTNKWQLLMKENPVICNELFLKYSK